MNSKVLYYIGYTRSPYYTNLCLYKATESIRTPLPKHSTPRIQYIKCEKKIGLHEKLPSLNTLSVKIQAFELLRLQRH